jgi:hypothetical protein
MIKVIILAYDYPPLPSAGAQRPYSWQLYLADNNIYPVVVTRHWNQDSGGAAGFVRPTTEQNVVISSDERSLVIKVPHKPNIRDRMLLSLGEDRWVMMRKILSFLLSFLRFFSLRFDNTKGIYKAAERYIKSNDCDLIIATGEPFILFKHAKTLSARFKIPYILDYRDGWTTGLDLQVNRRWYNSFSRPIFRKLEILYLKKASFVTVASETYINHIQKLRPDLRIAEVLNGYFEDSFSNIPEKRKECLTITYSGKLYQFQPIEAFLGVLKESMKTEQFPAVTIKWLGGLDDAEISNRIKKFITEPGINIELLARQGYEEYAATLTSSDILLLLGDDIGGWVNAKLYDYLAARRNILLFRSDRNIMEKIISDCKAGYICQDESELQDILRLVFKEFREHGQLTCTTQGYERFSREKQVRKLADIISKCVE